MTDPTMLAVEVARWAEVTAAVAVTARTPSTPSTLC